MGFLKSSHIVILSACVAVVFCAKESPLLSILSPSVESVMLRVCTVKVVGVVLLGPWIKKKAPMVR